jgi:MFS family permease
MMLFLLFTADAMMSYYAPLVIEQVTGSPSKMGLILAFSSVVGMTIDFLFAQFFSQKRAFFFQRILFFAVFLFPLSFLLSHSTFAFLMAMMWWGISYEAMIFCTYHAIHEAVGRVQHAWAWGLVSILKNIALTIGPIVASNTYAQAVGLPAFYAIMLNGAGLVLFFLYLTLEKNHHDIFQVEYTDHPSIHRRSLSDTLKIWRTVNKVIWPLLLFFLLFYFFDSAVYTVGPLLTEQLKQQHQLGGLFVSIYGIPGIFVGFFIPSLSSRFGKKKVAFVTGIIGGLAVLFMSLPTIVMILGAMFITSLCVAIFDPELIAVFEDLVARSEPIANDIISMTAITGSIGYVIGPIINGFLYDFVGGIRVFQIWGIAIFFCAMWLFFTFPRKIKMPQREIQEIMN